jgi:hypothetical protein
MTRKHFIAIADDIGMALHEMGGDYETFVFDHLVPKLASDFASFNPHFDEIKFIERIEEHMR